VDDLPVPDVLAKYQTLIHGFITHQIPAPNFESCYLKMFKNETEILGQHVFDILEDLFTSADGYVADPERAAAREAYRQLFGE
jgi:hypothetical protein